jgi:sensor domain CHASE-containing protein
MNLRSKVVLILLVIFVLLLFVDLAVQHAVILPSFVELETNEARKDMDRAMRSVTAELDHLTTTVINDAHWDEVYEFVQDGNANHVEVNLGGAAVFSGYGVNLIHFYNVDGALVWGAEGDPITDEKLTFPGLTGRDLSPDHILLKRTAPFTGITGLYMSVMGPLLVSAQPILTSESTGPERGTLVMARHLDDAAIQRFGTIAQVNFHMTAIKVGSGYPEQQEFLSRIDRETEYPIDYGDDVTTVYSAIESIDHENVFLFTVSVPREISQRGKSAVVLASLLLVGAGPALLVVLLLVLQKTIFAPTMQLKRHAVAIAETDNLDSRLDMDRHDEIGLLAREFDRMVERLAEVRRKFVEQSYRAGIAETASGFLHNIRNAITPSTVQIHELASTLDGLPLDSLGMAFEELAGVKASRDRRVDLATFGRLAVEEIGKTSDAARSELKALAGQLVHIQDILRDQERFTRSERVFERAQLKSLVAEGVAALSGSRPESVEIEIDQSVDAAGFLEAARTAVVQVISNIVLNGLEAIAHTDRSNGRLKISAARESIDQVEKVRLCFEDNGVGIPSEQISRIFENGYSSKKAQGRGLGLHWSANTVRAMGGSIHAESGGVGEGAKIHLILPTQSPRSDVASHEEAV